MNFLLTFLRYLTRLSWVRSFFVWWRAFPRALRSWIAILFIGLSCAVTTVTYASLLFFWHGTQSRTEATSPGAGISLELVRSLIEVVRSRADTLPEPVSIDPAQ